MAPPNIMTTASSFHCFIVCFIVCVIVCVIICVLTGCKDNTFSGENLKNIMILSDTITISVFYTTDDSFTTVLFK